MTYKEFFQQNGHKIWWGDFKICLARYHTGSIDEYKSREYNAHQWIDYAFEWGRTPQGHDCWQAIYRNLGGV